MTAFYAVKGLDYPEKPTTSSVVWGSQILKVSSTVVAYRTEKSGNWRAYEACVSIPDNALMLKDSVETKVVSGIGPGSWGDWRKDLKYVDSNAYGPTKVCRGFDHQIHDQDRVLEIAVNYKLPKQEYAGKALTGQADEHDVTGIQFEVSTALISEGLPKMGFPQ